VLMRTLCSFSHGGNTGWGWPEWLKPAPTGPTTP